MYEHIRDIIKEMGRSGPEAAKNVDSMIEQHILDITKKFVPCEENVHNLIREYLGHLRAAKVITGQIVSEKGHIGGHHPEDILRHLQQAHNLIFRIDRLLKEEEHIANRDM